MTSEVEHTAWHCRLECGDELTGTYEVGTKVRCPIHKRAEKVIRVWRVTK